MIDPVLRDFVAHAAAGAVVGTERIATGASRSTFRVTVDTRDGSRSFVLRCDTGDGPLSGTELTLAREAAVYRALADTGVRIPRLIAAHPDGTALLVEHVAGSDAFAALSELDARQRVVDDYFESLAALHRLDPEKLAVDELGAPGPPAQAARADLSLWRRIATSRLPEREALLELAFDWLAVRAPAGAERISLCHGDAGPGNFLFDERGVTGLLDWEFAHWGDPLDDLAWIAVRAQLLGGFGDLARGYQVWSRASGLRVEAERLEYYRALVLTRMAVSCLAGLAHAGAHSLDTGVYALLLPYLRALLPQALARAGCEADALARLLADGVAAVAASPVLRAHARPLDPLPVS